MGGLFHCIVMDKAPILSTTDDSKNSKCSKYGFKTPVSIKGRTVLFVVAVAGGVFSMATYAGQGWGDGAWDSGQRSPVQQRERQYATPDRLNAERSSQGGQRMTPDERKQLRRDLHDVNRDIYSQRRDERR